MSKNKPDFNATFQTTLDDQRAGPLVEVDASLDGPTIAEQVGIAAEDVGEVEGDEDEQHEGDDDEDSCQLPGPPRCPWVHLPSHGLVSRATVMCCQSLC